MASNPVRHRRTKHIELDIHFVREKVAIGEVRILHVPTGEQFADIMTKGLPTLVFQEFRSSLGASQRPMLWLPGGVGDVVTFLKNCSTLVKILLLWITLVCYNSWLGTAHCACVHVYKHKRRSTQVALTLQSSFSPSCLQTTGRIRDPRSLQNIDIVTPACVTISQ